jgi:two-component system chemotaxis response regulator CheY
MKELLSSFGDCDIAINGQEAIDSFHLAHVAKRPYDVIFMDIMMPIVDGIEALQVIRALEKQMRISPGTEVKIVMTTALEDPRTVIKSFNKGEATSYLVKPITRQKLAKEMASLKLLSSLKWPGLNFTIMA